MFVVAGTTLNNAPHRFSNSMEGLLGGNGRAE
jgi:hypothetical protein